MKCGWGCGAQLTGRNMRAHFTICLNRCQPLTTGMTRENRMPSADTHRGAERCAAGLRAELAGRQMRAHFSR
jgi:hypothetical protein